MSPIDGEWWVTVAESQQLLHLIFPNYPDLKPRIDVDVQAFKQQVMDRALLRFDWPIIVVDCDTDAGCW
jgi:hypothetical protein